MHASSCRNVFEIKGKDSRYYHPQDGPSISRHCGHRWENAGWRNGAPAMEKGGSKTCKPDSVPQRDCPLYMDDHFSGIRVTSNLKRPTRRPRPGQSVCKNPYGALHLSSYLALHRATLTLPVMSPSPRWALTPPFHPYLSRSDQIVIPSPWPSAVCFLWCWCRIAPPGSYPAPCPWSPDFPLGTEAPSDHPVFPPRSVSIMNTRGSLQAGEPLCSPDIRLSHSTTVHQSPIRAWLEGESVSGRWPWPQASIFSTARLSFRARDGLREIPPGYCHRKVAPSAARDE